MPQVSIRKSNHGSKENKGDTDDSKNENENNSNSNSNSNSNNTKKSRMRRDVSRQSSLTDR